MIATKPRAATTLKISLCRRRCSIFSRSRRSCSSTSRRRRPSSSRRSASALARLVSMSVLTASNRPPQRSVQAGLGKVASQADQCCAGAGASTLSGSCSNRSALTRRARQASPSRNSRCSQPSFGSAMARQQRISASCEISISVSSPIGRYRRGEGRRHRQRERRRGSAEAFRTQPRSRHRAGPRSAGAGSRGLRR